MRILIVRFESFLGILLPPSLLIVVAHRLGLCRVDCLVLFRFCIRNQFVMEILNDKVSINKNVCNISQKKNWKNELAESFETRPQNQQILKITG